MSTEASRAGTRSLLESLLDTSARVSGAAGLRVKVFCLQEWQCIWPRRLPEDDPKVPVVHLALQAAGTETVIDLADLQSASGRGTRSAVASSWCKALSVHQDSPSKMTIEVFISRLSAAKPHPLLSQVLWQVGLHLDNVFGSQSSGKGPPKVFPVMFQWTTLQDDLSPNAVNRKLYKYVQSGRRVLSGNTEFGIATDKAWVGSLPLQASLLVVPSGYGVVACPQVLSGRVARAVC